MCLVCLYSMQNAVSSAVISGLASKHGSVSFILSSCQVPLKIYSFIVYRMLFLWILATG